MSEKVVVNSKTGGAKGQKDVQMSLVPIEELQEVAKLYAYGARKYAPHNWRKGYDWSLSYDALMRHIQLFWNGESTHLVIEGDEETRISHLTSVIFHAFALMYFEKHHPDLDDRFKKEYKSDNNIVIEADLLPGHVEWAKLAKELEDR